MPSEDASIEAHATGAPSRRKSTDAWPFVSSHVNVMSGQKRDAKPATNFATCSRPYTGTRAAAQLAAIVEENPVSELVELAGPEKIGLDELVRRLLAVEKDPRRVVMDVQAPDFGAVLDDHSLTAGPAARLGRIRYEEWLAAK